MSKVLSHLLADARVENIGKAYRDSIFMQMKTDGQYDRCPGVSDSLKRAVLVGVRAPSRHAADIQLPVRWRESTAVRPRVELTIQGNYGPLQLLADLIAEEQEVGPRAK